MTHQNKKKKSSEKTSVITVVLTPRRLTQSHHARKWPSSRLGTLLPWIPLVASGRRATLQRRSSRQLPQHKLLKQALITSSLAIFSRGPLLGPVHGARRAKSPLFIWMARRAGWARRGSSISNFHLGSAMAPVVVATQRLITLIGLFSKHPGEISKERVCKRREKIYRTCAHSTFRRLMIRPDSAGFL